MMAVNNAPLMAQTLDTSKFSDFYRDGQKLRDDYDIRQTEKELGNIMKQAPDLNGRLELAQQSRYAGKLIPLLQQYDEARQKAALDNLKSSADINKVYGETGKFNAEAVKIGADTESVNITNAGATQSAIANAATPLDPELFRLGIGELYKRKVLTEAQVDGYIKLSQRDPVEAQKALKALVMSNPELAKIFKPEAKVLDAKDSAYLYSVDGLTGQAGAPTAQIKYGQSPDNFATNQTSENNNVRTTNASMANNQYTVDAGERNNVRTNQTNAYGIETRSGDSRYATDTAANTNAEKLAVDWYKAETGAAVAQQNANTAATKAQPVVGANGQPIRELAANERTKLFELQEKVDADIGVGESLKKLNTLVDQAYSGAGAGIRGTFMSRIPGGNSNDRANATVLSENITTELALKQLKSTFGAAPTEGERKILMDLQASVDKTPEQKMLIIASAMRAVTERIRYRKDQMEGIRTGRYAVPTGYSSKSGNKGAQQTSNSKGGSIIGGILGSK